MTGDLSATQETFCVEYAATGNAIESYKKAFSLQSIPDDKAKQYSNELLSDPTIKQRVIRLQDIASPKEILTKTSVLEELSQIVRTALFPADRLKALDLLGKYYKLFSERDTSQKVYVGENKIQIIYMSPDHKRITSISPLRKHQELLPTVESIAEPSPDTTDVSFHVETSTTSKSKKSQLEKSQLEKDLDDLCG